jgi:hypothetical protein
MQSDETTYSHTVCLFSEAKDQSSEHNMPADHDTETPKYQVEFGRSSGAKSLSLSLSHHRVGENEAT